MQVFHYTDSICCSVIGVCMVLCVPAKTFGCLFSYSVPWLQRQKLPGKQEPR